jgi:hypothetical protein
MLIRATKFAWGAFFLAVFAVCWAPHGQRFTAVLLSALVFASVLSCFPRCRPVVEAPLCPWNWALLAFSLKLVGMPLLITIEGPSLGVLPNLPSAFAINMAMVLDSAAFLTVCAVYNHFARFRTSAGAALSDRLRNAPEAYENGSARAIVFCTLLGVGGVFFSFGNFAGLLEYFNNPGFYSGYLADLSSTWRGLFALFLKPFLGFAIIMAWCRWNDSDGVRSSSWRRILIAVLVLAGVVFSFSLFNYNRGSIAVPLIGIAAVALVKGDKLSWRLMLVAGLLVLVLSPVYAIYRSGTELGENLLEKSDVLGVLVEDVDISDIVQAYGGAPQYLGFLLEKSHWGRDPHWGAVTVSSILSPLPVLGKPFRAESGIAVYNRVVYGTDAIADQNISLQGEAFLDFHIPGILFVFAVFGCVLHYLQQAFERSRSSLEVYIWQYFAVWMCFAIFAGIGVLSQILIYFCWPLYLFIYHQLPRSSITSLQPSENHIAGLGA